MLMTTVAMGNLLPVFESIWSRFCLFLDDSDDDHDLNVNGESFACIWEYLVQVATLLLSADNKSPSSKILPEHIV